MTWSNSDPQARIRPLAGRSRQPGGRGEPSGTAGGLATEGRGAKSPRSSIESFKLPSGGTLSVGGPILESGSRNGVKCNPPYPEPPPEPRLKQSLMRALSFAGDTNRRGSKPLDIDPAIPGTNPGHRPYTDEPSRGQNANVSRPRDFENSRSPGPIDPFRELGRSHQGTLQFGRNAHSCPTVTIELTRQIKQKYDPKIAKL